MFRDDNAFWGIAPVGKSSVIDSRRGLTLAVWPGHVTAFVADLGIQLGAE
jgi:hypothetical protein